MDHPGGRAPGSISSKSPLSYEPSSPLSLAISAILALVPHPRDVTRSSGEAVLLRRSTAEKFARAAIEQIDTDSDFVESATHPSQALQNEKPTITRQPFHPRTPLELEAILALLILCIYEYAQRGNLLKMRSRAGQAYVLAMNMSLHSLGAQDDEFSEARRRAWWMTVRWPPCLTVIMTFLPYANECTVLLCLPRLYREHHCEYSLC